MKSDSLFYSGSVQPQMGEHDVTGSPLFPYIPGPDLVEVVNQAIYLERPLLISGEPGVGKTSLAKSVAYELKLPFESWYIRSKSSARDGLYSYDAAAQMRDAQLISITRSKKLANISNTANYVRLGPLGRAFMNDQRTVLLIEEIDKADIDFPDDLLLELNEKRFVIEETGQLVQAKYSPIIFITTNNNRQLPSTFVRRCIYHQLVFPSNVALMSIIAWYFPQTDIKLVGTAVERLSELRWQIRENRSSQGNLGIEEMIDMVHYLSQYPIDEAMLKVEDIRTYARFSLQSSAIHERVSYSRPLQVFLCHSSGDKEAVRTLYDKLHIEGIDPWLDEEKLLPGQDWEQEIKKAVRTSDVVLVCLSRKSINKSGFVQKEIKYALDIAEEKPEGTIYIIPLKLEECDIPDQLHRWQWVKLFEGNGLEKLMQSLKNRVESLNTLEE